MRSIARRTTTCLLVLTLWGGASPAAADGATPTPPATPAATTPTATAAATQTTGAASAAATPVTPSVTPTAAAAQDPFKDREDRLALMLDRARVGAGVLPLARSTLLDRAAQTHAQDMVAQGYMDHDAPDGSTPASRAAQQGYQTPAGSGWIVVETISAASDEPDGPTNYWLSDGLHRRVVLRSYFREFGIGFAPGGPYGRFWVAVFGCRPNMLPPVLLDGTLFIPDETCGHTSDAFGSVDSVKAAETSDATARADWQAYGGQQPWPTGRPAVVDMRDANGKQIEVSATDPTGSPTSATSS